MIDEDSFEMVAPSDHHRWIEANRDWLNANPNSFAAHHPKLGIVAHAEDGEEFSKQLISLPEHIRQDAVRFHTSMYVR